MNNYDDDDRDSTKATPIHPQVCNVRFLFDIMQG